MERELTIKVYLEDTDAQGIVYHANYLKYFERGRTEILMAFGATPAGYGERELRFVVHEARLKYSRSATLGDTLVVRTRPELASAYRLSYHHDVFRQGEPKPLVTGVIDVVCIDRAGELTEFPSELLTQMGLTDGG